MKGISHAINLGILAATDEEYYAWIGDDDLFLPAGLITLRNLIDKDPHVVVSFGGCRYIDPDGRVLRTNSAGELAKWLVAWGPNLIPHPGSVIRLSALRDIGLFDETLKYAMDLDVFLKLRSAGKFACTKTPVSAFRWHPGSLTVSARKRSGKEAEMIKRRHLPVPLRRISPLWSTPVSWAAMLAARSLNAAADGGATVK
jgi:GT2 family glycosyltransferase